LSATITKRLAVAKESRTTVRYRLMTDFDGLPVLLTVPRAAEILGISRASAYRYVELGLLPVKRLGGRIYIVRDRLRELVESA
jgi:excisionase family DNA binding protein